jgi:sugar phosphate isomerase/epimerase
MKTRRRFLTAMAASPGLIAAGGSPFRWAICSETFQGMSFPAACAAAKRCGYSGIEIEPAHLSVDPASLGPGERRQARQAMEKTGVRYVGLHSFLKAPAGLHLTTPDPAVRSRTWECFRRLIDLAADLGDGAIMVLGSSRQRAAIGGVTPADALKQLEEGLAKVAPAAEARGVTILVEPLAPHLCNVINTIEEALAVVAKIGSPAVQSMFDTHNTSAEKLPQTELIRRHFARIRHVHLNEMDGRYPGSADYPFGPLMQTLKDLKYRGWLSVEVFDFKPDGEIVARLAIEHLRRVESTLT